MGKKKGPDAAFISPTRRTVSAPGVSIDVREMANEQNPGNPTRPKRGRQISRRAEWENKGIPSAEQLSMYADYISGMTLKNVSAKYAFASTSQPSIIIKRVNRWLVPKFMGDIREIKCEHTERLLHIASEAMTAWERSKRDKVQFEHERGDDGKLKLLKMKREPQAGNPTFLATAMKALEDIRKVWGADAPVRMEVSGEIRVAGRTVEQARMELATQMEQARMRLLASSEN